MNLMLEKIRRISHWLLPRVCVGCGFDSYELTLDLCVDCKVNLPWLPSGCYQCGLQLHKPSESIICNKCQDSPPPFNRLCALFSYKPPLTKLIASFKFGRQLYPGALFSQLLAEAVTESWYVNKALPQIIIPVPLHMSRQRQRGYNQAAEISHQLAAELNIGLELDACLRVKNTKAQARLNKNKRTRNLEAAFIANIKPSYKHVALIDDVVTTGSTIRAVSKALVSAGVEQIDVWCVCRA